jgi:hypothetical protein
MKYLSIIVVMGSLFFGACETNTNGGKLGTFDAIVEGTVTSENGNAVSGADVLITSHSVECNDIQEDGISHGVTSTDSKGKFLKKIHKPTKDLIRCLNLDINAGTYSGIADTTVSVSTMLKLKNSTPLNKENINIAY